MSTAETLADALEGIGAGSIVIVTGAGISLASGIPTFRGTDPGAVWKRDITELGTFRYFSEDPVGSWRWYLSRFDRVLRAAPNPAHEALVDLERWHANRGGSFLLVTQNVDPLHERAGSEALVKVHGSADRVRCARDGCRHGAPTGSLQRDDAEMTRFLDAPGVETLPRCPSCNGILRQHVLWFDEVYTSHADYQWERVQEAAVDASLMLFVGTSFAVGVTELFLQIGHSTGATMLSIDPGAETPPFPGVSLLRAEAETLLPAVVARLR